MMRAIKLRNSISSFLGGSDRPQSSGWLNAEIDLHKYAPGSWIEQLAARKTRFKFDKVIAVSTTGFAKGASEFAESQGISLRTVQRIADIATDFNIQEIRFYANQIMIGPTDMKVTNPALADIDILGNAKFKFVGEAY
jgi:hypothetical protein